MRQKKKVPNNLKAALLQSLGLLAFFLYLYLFGVDIPTITATAQCVDITTYLLAIIALSFETKKT